MRKKQDVMHIPIPETRPPGRKANTEDEGHAPSVPPMRPSEGPAKTPGHHHHEPRIIAPQPSSTPYPGVGVS
jgi:hypothetical protein